VTLAKKKFDPKTEPCIRECIEFEHIEQETSRLINSTNTELSVSTKTVFKKGNIFFGKLRPYLFQPVQTDYFIDKANVASGTHMPRADWSVVQDILFTLPPIKEQQKIAAVLSAADKKFALSESDRTGRCR
jgi:type I restriction enzyme S subunit